MRLSKRIYKLAEMVQAGETAADIGTDHGYVPMLLIKNGISPKVIMSDISEGSLSKAIETFKTAQLPADESDFRLGDGLETLDFGETDTVIIAGLGGHTIVDVLSSDVKKSKSFKRLILQPRKHSGALRYYLYTNGWDITEEVLIKEGKFECEIITAAPSEYEYRKEKYPEDDIRWKYPEEMVFANPELSKSRIEWKIGSIDEQINNLQSSSSEKAGIIRSLERDREYLTNLIKDII